MNVEQNVEQQMENESKDKQTKFDKIYQRVIDSNGFLTSEGKLICKAEWHAVAIGFSFPALAYLLPTPLGEFFIIAMLLMLRVGFKRIGTDLKGHLQDVFHEFAYMITTAVLTVALFQLIGVGELETIDVGRLMAKILLGP
uniref:Hypothetical membrane protein n=1 Tax=uncultured virus TaxID=340016 RepID=D5L2Q4_9VIRU|nr:hypothetical membrane protein [uncultured virus]